mgnify:CR=1 FL=1
MAIIHFTLDSKDILYMLKHDSAGAFAKLLKNSLNQLMQIESNEQLKAQPYERTEKRTDLRNGTRERQLYTRIGTLTLRVPRPIGISRFTRWSLKITSAVKPPCLSRWQIWWYAVFPLVK